MIQRTIINPPEFIVVDLFCGAGGTSTGFEATEGVAIVIAGVNHDRLAIKSHAVNHPFAKHFTEDMRTLDLTELVTLVAHWRKRFPHAKLVLWASLECTNYSNAKGGQSRDADSRTLANHLDRYIIALDPDIIQIENVVEFMAWGPLKIKAAKKHKEFTELRVVWNKKKQAEEYHWEPESKTKGRDWMAWRERICSYGYRDDWRKMNSADWGAYTSRKRLFGMFAKPGIPIEWPEATHSKNPNPSPGLFGPNFQKWKPVRDVLDLEDHGTSIFARKKPLKEKTLERIYAGLIKFVAGGESAFMLKYNSMNKNGRYTPPSLDEPCPVIATQSRLGIVKAAFIAKHYSGRPEGKCISLEGPAGTITTVDHHSLVTASFLTKYHGKGFNVSTDAPAPTLATRDQIGLVSAYCIDNPGWFGSSVSVDQPSPTLIARQDKAPLYLMLYRVGRGGIPIYDDDSPMTIKIKEFMAMYGLSDVMMRMLKVSEMLRIQGFPEGYYLAGSETHQKKFIGNSVHPIMPKVWALAISEAMRNNENHGQWQKAS